MVSYIEEINYIKLLFKDYDLTQIRQYIDDNLQEEMEALKKEFIQQYKDVDNNDPEKVAILNTLQDFGILINVNE